MSDDGDGGEEQKGVNPLDHVEMLAALMSLGQGARTFFDALIENKFSDDQAMKIVCAWVAGGIGGYRG